MASNEELQTDPTALTLYKDDIEFKKEIPKDLNIDCSICLAVILDSPSQASCCGQHFCGPCIGKVNACPQCRAVGDKFKVFKDTDFERRVGSLEVYCLMNWDSDDSCDWSGELRHLQRHLDDSCPYVEVPCPNHGCNKSGLLRCDLKEHVKKYCPMRPYKCRHCDFRDTHKFVTEIHYDICPLFPVCCPLNCSKGKTFPRNEIEDHIKRDCPLQPVECTYSWLGCEEKPARRDLNRHCSKQHKYILSDVCKELCHESQKMADGLNANETHLEHYKTEQGRVDEKVSQLEKKVTLLEQQLKTNEKSHNERTRHLEQAVTEMNRELQQKIRALDRERANLQSSCNNVSYSVK
ncbi:PREDICTED: TNF receptor-associated factor 5-like [Amphimedon queenslandica]|uniref:RING-type domain-containing protein n=1 Tax=Amphimedon queenslandica TaxID=400682 RepID=A0AAN0IPQ0_AMPQE|nr:PREDICTED: TNF receptor-associated factor 5-like [Amphimedon queenslandica]|eukprot:XP_011405980.1 PREDICTED: TNF receptor-associated factor 5-like [Amphimedon queenslandica]